MQHAQIEAAQLPPFLCLITLGGGARGIPLGSERISDGGECRRVSALAKSYPDATARASNADPLCLLAGGDSLRAIIKLSEEHEDRGNAREGRRGRNTFVQIRGGKTDLSCEQRIGMPAGQRGSAPLRDACFANQMLAEKGKSKSNAARAA